MIKRASCFIIIRQPALFPSFSFFFLSALCPKSTFQRHAPAHARLHVRLHGKYLGRFDTWGRFDRFRALGERLVGMLLVPLDPTLSRGLNFDYMNQVLAWQTLQELLTSLRPLVAANVHMPSAVWHACRSTLLYASYSFSHFRQRLLPSSSGSNTVHDGSAEALSLTTQEAAAAAALPARRAHQGDGEGEMPGWACAICNAIPANSPHLSSCTHVFCYVCLRTAQASGQGRSVCPECSRSLTSCKRLHHPILGKMQQL